VTRDQHESAADWIALAALAVGCWACFAVFSSCVPWGNYRAVPTVGVGYDPATGNEYLSGGVTLAPGLHLDAETRAILGGSRGAPADAERVTALTGEVEKERAAAVNLRAQVAHLEADLATRTTERDEALTAEAGKAKRVGELEVELAEAQDWARYVDGWIERFGFWGTLLMVIALGIFGVLGLRAWARKRGPKKK